MPEPQVGVEYSDIYNTVPDKFTDLQVEFPQAINIVVQEALANLEYLTSRDAADIALKTVTATACTIHATGKIAEATRAGNVTAE